MQCTWFHWCTVHTAWCFFRRRRALDWRFSEESNGSFLLYTNTNSWHFISVLFDLILFNPLFLSNLISNLSLSENFIEYFFESVSIFLISSRSQWILRCSVLYLYYAYLQYLQSYSYFVFTVFILLHGSLDQSACRRQTISGRYCFGHFILHDIYIIYMLYGIDTEWRLSSCMCCEWN